MSQKWKNYVHSLSFRMIVIFLVCNLSIILILGYSMIRISASTLTGEVKNYTAKTLEQATLTLDTGFSYIRSSLIMLANNNTVISCMNRSMDTVQQLEADRAITAITQDLNLYQPVISDIFLVGKNGYVNNISSRQNLIWDYPYTKTDWFLQSINDSNKISCRMLGVHRQDFYSPYVMAEEAKKDTASMSMIVRDGRKKIVGSVVCNFSLSALGKQLMSSNYEKSGRIALIDDSGSIITQNGSFSPGTPIGLSEQNLKEIRNHPSGTFQGSLSGRQYLFLYNTSSVSGWKLVSYIPLSEIDSHSKKMLQTVQKAVLLILILNFLLSAVMLEMVRKPIRRLLSRLDQISGSNLAMPKDDYAFSELNTISDKFSELLQRLNFTIEHDMKSQIMMEKANFHALQAQINPHFLFNMLQLLQTEILYENYKVSNEIIVSMSHLLRYTLGNNVETVPVERELQYIKDYLNLFDKKFEGKLRVSYDISDKVLAYRMPKLLLQPVVENCILHGFHTNFKSGTIRVTAREEESGLVFVIEDNGTGIEPERLEQIRKSFHEEKTDENSIGLRNMHQRIRMLYAGDYGVFLESVPGKSTTVTVRIGKMKEGASNEITDRG